MNNLCVAVSRKACGTPEMGVRDLHRHTGSSGSAAGVRHIGMATQLESRHRHSVCIGLGSPYHRLIGTPIPIAKCRYS